MTKHTFKNPCIVRDLRDGSVAPLLAGFAAALAAQGYSSDTRGRYVSSASHLADWAMSHGIATAEFDEALVTRFMRHVVRCRWRSRRRRDERVRRHVDGFLRYLREVRVVGAAPAQARSALLTAYEAWMRDQRGFARSTVSYSLRVVEALLASVTDDPTRLSVGGVRGFVFQHIRLHAPASAGTVTTSVRCFLRYLVMQGRCSTDLVDGVPKVPTWRLAKLPRYLPDDDIERIIAATDRESVVARRDHAMLLLLARLGLRASDVVGLRLGDLDWEHGRVRVAGKSRRETALPLAQDVGDAILRYLQADRPGAATDRVFLTACTPIRPITSSGLRDVLWRAIERAGVRSPSLGTHVLRHSLATRLLRQGVTLDGIGAVLRHRDVNTTALYAKVDFGLLRQIAQPWPEAQVPPC